jgi:glyoxylase-like metal-dependent hydrolase (beta-lactamase superfamily II)
MALIACPTASIGSVQKHDVKAAQAAFPDLITPGVYHCGYHDESSFGATSYLLVRDQDGSSGGGNILVDAPRFNKPLLRRLEEMGGVKTIFLTHRDDVGDYAKFADHFGATTVIHRDDVGPDTERAELKVEGTESVTLDPEVTLVPVPGHTRGSMCLIYRDEVCFAGDHVAWSPSRKHVYAFRDSCWYSWGEQVRSMERLALHRFEWILPGHGERCHFGAPEMQAQMATCIAWMKKKAR